jgi:hypothetical protein
MRKPKQPTQSSDADANIDAAVLAIAGIALVGIFGGLAVVFGWKAIVAGAPFS